MPSLLTSMNLVSTASLASRSVRQSSHSGAMAACVGEADRSVFPASLTPLPKLTSPLSLTNSDEAPV